MRRIRAILKPRPPVSGTTSDAPGAHFPAEPEPLDASDGPFARSDVGEPDLGPPNNQPGPGPTRRSE